MALNDSLDNLARMSAGQKLAALFLPIVLLGLAYWQSCYVAISDQQQSLESQQYDLLQDQARLDKDLEDKKRLIQRKEELEQSIRANQRALPTAAELPAFFDFLQRRAGEAGVNIRRWDQQPSENVDIYVRVPVKIQVGGSFLNLVKYFYLLGPQNDSRDARGAETLGVGERIVSVENLALGNPTIEDGEVSLVADFTAATFYLNPKSAPGGQAQAPKAPGPAGGAR